jgi:hypothetical protein
MAKKIFSESDHGVTMRSAEFVALCLPRIGQVVKIRGYKLGGLDYWVEFSDAEDNVIRTSGFSWGYWGEGPNGLRRASELVGIPLTIRQICSIPSDNNWTADRELGLVIDL